jgi:hypothetical protein
MALGFGIGIPFIRRRGDSFTPEYQAILARATALGYTLPSAGVQVKQNNLLKELIAAGIWDKLDVFYLFAQDGQAEFGTLNWKAPLLYQSTLVNSPTFTSNKGFAGNGSSSYINTNFNPSTGGVNYVRNNASVVLYMDTINDSGLKFFCGAINGPLTSQLAEDNTPNNMRPDINGDNSGVGNVAKIGAKWFGMNRDNSTEVKLFQNTTLSTNADPSNGVPNANMTLLVRSDLFGYSNRRISFFSMGSNLVTENTNYNTAFLNYFNSL